MRRLVFALAAIAFGCQSIAGIEDRVYDPPIVGSPECEAYCTDVMAACADELSVYDSRETCIATCEKLPKEGATGATVECFAKQASLAKTVEPNIHCASAGPYGGGNCGSACQSYCALLEATCSDAFALVDDCVAKCGGLENGGFVPPAERESGDALECRIQELTRAALEPADHCGNVAIIPGLESVCVDPATEAPTCSEYCNLVMVTCTAELAVYESVAECEAVCAALPPGTTGDRTENTVGCRKYHSYSSAADPNTHCAHTGPGGDGHCGLDGSVSTGNCDSYCILLGAACPAELQAMGGEDGCKASCKSLDGALADSKYAVTPVPSGDNLQCRFYQLSKTLTGTPSCAAAVGGAPCQ